MTGCQKVPILYWIHSPTRILTLMFSSIRASSTLFVHLTLSTDYLSTVLLANEFLTNISKKRISKLDASLLDNVVSLHGQVTKGHCSIRLLYKKTN